MVKNLGSIGAALRNKTIEDAKGVVGRYFEQKFVGVLIDVRKMVNNCLLMGFVSHKIEG